MSDRIKSLKNPVCFAVARSFCKVPATVISRKVSAEISITCFFKAASFSSSTKPYASFWRFFTMPLPKFCPPLTASISTLLLKSPPFIKATAYYIKNIRLVKYIHNIKELSNIFAASEKPAYPSLSSITLASSAALPVI